jgi:chaperone required for assembly of F1-ATPase
VKRFYSAVALSEVAGGWQVTLDGRGIRTVKGAAQIVPTRALADALAAEWAQQGERIDPAGLPLRDMADYAIDMVSDSAAATIETLLAYAETDTLCYRADPEDALFARQQVQWEPLLAAFEQREGVQFTRISGIVHRAQPPGTLAILRDRLARENAFALAGLEAATGLAASLVCALSACEPEADAAAIWQAASLEEEWQAELWGRDAEAEIRRDRRSADFRRAVAFTRAARSC